MKCFQVLKHVACLCKAVILCQSSSSQLYLPSRVQSPGSFEQKSLITRPSVLSSCSCIQLDWMSNSRCRYLWAISDALFVFTLLTWPAGTYSKGWSWNISSCTGQAGAATWTTTSSCRSGTGWGRSGREAQVQQVRICGMQTCSNLLGQFITTNGPVPKMKHLALTTPAESSSIGWAATGASHKHLLLLESIRKLMQRLSKMPGFCIWMTECLVSRADANSKCCKLIPIWNVWVWLTKNWNTRKMSK